MQTNADAIFELNAQTTAPLDELERKLLAVCKEIEAWFSAQWEKTAPPVYGSVDLRNEGFKLAPIDMNLFPAGFNNLNDNHLPISVAGAKKILQHIAPEAKKILILPESHTRNLFYWDNIKTLQTILQQAGYETRIGVISDEEAASLAAPAINAGAEPLLRSENKLHVGSFLPDVILLNNDLSVGIPDLLQNIDQPMIPPAELGWSQRLKSEHFRYYAEVTAEFSEQFKFDPWLIAPLFRHCGQIDFMRQEGMECLIADAEMLFAAVQKKYAEYDIPYQPFLIIKADAGTYGMAVMTVRNLDELRNMNRKQRTRMSTIKGGQAVNRVIIQEGIYTFETFGVERAVAEPVVYLWGSTVVGGFYRVHKSRGTDENLNAPGMEFEPHAFTHSCQEPTRFYVYGIVAMLSMLAAAREMKDEMANSSRRIP